MKANKSVPLVLATLIAVGATGGMALAKGSHDEGNDAAALANAKVTLTQAIATAEQQAGGRAIGAGVDDENGRVTIAVEVAAKEGVRTVLIDPATGQVVGPAVNEIARTAAMCRSVERTVLLSQAFAVPLA